MTKRLQKDRSRSKAKIDDQIYFGDNNHGLSGSKLSLSKSRGSKRLAPPNLHIRAGSKGPRRMRGQMLKNDSVDSYENLLYFKRDVMDLSDDGTHNFLNLRSTLNNVEFNQQSS